MRLVAFIRLAAFSATVLCASAQAFVADSFTTPASSSTGWVIPNYDKAVNYVGSEPVGGSRVMVAGTNDPSPGSTQAWVSAGSFFSATSVDGVSGSTALIYGQGAPRAQGQDLALGWGTADTFELDVASGSVGLIAVFLYQAYTDDWGGTGYRNGRYFINNATSGTHVIPLSSFSGLSGQTAISAIAIYFQGFSAAGFSVSEIRLNQVSSVPEPETWALMAAGVGALGALARRRRRTAC